MRVWFKVTSWSHSLTRMVLTASLPSNCLSHSHLASARWNQATNTGNRLNDFHAVSALVTWLKPGVNENGCGAYRH